MQDIINNLSNSFIEYWYMIPVFIILIAIKIFIENKERNLYKEKLEKKSNNTKLKELTEKKYKDNGYIILENKIKGIDLICQKDKKTVLVLCKSTSIPSSINHQDIKAFHSNAIKYIELNNLNKSNTTLRYTVFDKSAFDDSALDIFEDEYYKCTCLIIEDT